MLHITKINFLLKSRIPRLSAFCSAKQNDHVDETDVDRLDPEMRDRLSVGEYSEYDKQFFPEHTTVRKPLSLYNFMSYLPFGLTMKIAKLTSETKTVIQSDNLYLPRLTKNGVPIYDAQRAGQFLRALKSAEIAIPILFIGAAHYPFTMLIGCTIAYFGIYRNSFTKLGNSLIIKMELVPETQEVIFQKVGTFGVIKTSRVKIDDLQYLDRSQLNDLIYYRSTRSIINKDLMFRVKSTGQLLTFDAEGVWYEQGINHELLI